VTAQRQLGSERRFGWSEPAKLDDMYGAMPRRLLLGYNRLFAIQGVAGVGASVPG